MLDPSIDLEVDGGDQNHANGPTDADRRLWEPRGFIPVLPDGTPTYDLDKAGGGTKALAVLFKMVGRLPNMHFDQMYLRPGPKRELVWGRAVYTPKQIGYFASAVPVGGTDHHEVVTTLTFPLSLV